MPKVFVILATLSLLLACQEVPNSIGEDDSGLPILGEKSVDPETGQTIYYTTPKFRLKNQFNERFNSDDLKGKIQVVDFFFTTCPSICPMMTSNMKIVEEAFINEDRVAILSFSIDPEIDTPEKLKSYAEGYHIEKDNWTFLTGSQDKILDLAHDYKVRAFDDSQGGQPNLIHDGTFVLVDGLGRIRGYYDGLSAEGTRKLVLDIDKLLNAKMK